MLFRSTVLEAKHRHVREAQDVSGRPELPPTGLRTSLASPFGLASPLSRSDAHQRDSDTSLHAPREQATTGERLVVRMGKHGQQRLACQRPLSHATQLAPAATH